MKKYCNRYRRITDKNQLIKECKEAMPYAKKIEKILNTPSSEDDLSETLKATVRIFGMAAATFILKFNNQSHKDFIKLFSVSIAECLQYFEYGRREEEKLKHEKKYSTNKL